ncbi:MAG: TonB-dependent receptor [Chloracidobacterium sp.]|nr:TonB-dependent receptor [Chloracidobacterium sp.]
MATKAIQLIRRSRSDFFQPVGFARTFSRVNPTWNFTDDFTWIKGNHSVQFGTNIRLIKNKRVNFARAFDNGITNPSAYPSNQARQALDQYIRVAAGEGAGSNRVVASSQSTNVQGALVALFGRLNGYGANFNFNVDGSVQEANTPVTRIFKTEEYDFYAQDTWKVRPNLTLTLGMRYGLSMPVYETQGFETAPNIGLSDYLERRREAMETGQNYQEPISVRLAGKVNGLDSMYPLDKNNWQPRASVAWSPDFEDGFWSKVFGAGSESVFRGGFAITNDYFGQQLATQWDGGNTLGFSSSSTINVNTYSIVDGPNAAPLYTGPSMNIRGLPNMVIPGSLSFPQTAPFSLPGAGKTEGSLDQNLVSPINYSWNVSYGRQLPGKIWLDVAYVGRMARNLLLSRDIMMAADPRDPVSGMTFREAATLVEQQLRAGTPITSIATIPFFDNMWSPGSLVAAWGPEHGVPAGYTNTQAVAWLRPNYTGDWGYMWQELSRYGLTNYFFQGQYDALSAHGTVGSSDYHGGTLSLRQRFTGLTWDFNYTYSKSIDDSSGLQTSGNFGGGSFVIDALNIQANRAVSDFDMRHVANFNGIWDIPIGRKRFIGGGMNKFLDAIVGGWQLSGVARFDSGINQGASGHYEDGTGWQTNWQRRSYPVLVRNIETATNFGSATAACNTANPAANCSLPNLFSDPDAVWNSFRTPFPGETGTRNALWLPGLLSFDAGLSKAFKMPWKEGHKASIRWDVFNVTNSAVFAGQALTLVGETGGNPDSPYFGSNAGATFGRFTSSRLPARVMQFAFRYEF